MKADSAEWRALEDQWLAEMRAVIREDPGFFRAWADAIGKEVSP